MLLVLLLLCLIAGYTDLRWHKIPNRLTYPATAGAVVMNGVASLISSPVSTEWGLIGWEASLSGAGLCFVVMLAVLLFFGIGGGDLKLLTMVGAFLGPSQGLEVLLWSAVLGAGVAVALLIWRVGLVKLIYYGLQHLASVLHLGRPLNLTDEEKKQLQAPLYLAPVTAVAVLLVVTNLFG